MAEGQTSNRHMTPFTTAHTFAHHTRHLFLSYTAPLAHYPHCTSALPHTHTHRDCPQPSPSSLHLFALLMSPRLFAVPVALPYDARLLPSRLNSGANNGRRAALFHHLFLAYRASRAPSPLPAAIANVTQHLPTSHRVAISLFSRRATRAWLRSTLHV